MTMTDKSNARLEYAITFKTDVDVELMRYMGNDESIVQAMLVSTQGVDSQEAEASQGRINFLMKNRHGTPFEHGSMTFFIAAPIFVFREFHRHRIGWSYNEVSGRYSELEPVFYVPGEGRNIVQVGKPGHYEYVPGTITQWSIVRDTIEDSSISSYEYYQELLAQGIAKEVARMCLPVNIFSSMYATCNPRSLMAFLSLRTKREDSMFPSYPQREIEMVAEKLEREFARLFPMTYRAFCENGRVSP